MAEKPRFDALGGNPNTDVLIGGDLLCDLAQDKSNPYASVFDPSRNILLPQLPVNTFDSVVGLLPTPCHDVHTLAAPSNTPAPSTYGIAPATARDLPKTANLFTVL